MASAENGAASDQQLRSCFDDGGHRVVSYAPIDFDTEAQVPFRSQFAQVPGFTLMIRTWWSIGSTS
jgi:hypothetical protein